MTLRLALLGDSLAHGTGAARPADTPAGRLAADLSAGRTPVQVRVAAVPGARSSDLAGQVAGLGTWAPHVAVVVVGANDLTAQVSAVAAAEALRRAVRALRARGARVVVVPAPDLSVVASVPAGLRAAVQSASARLRSAQAAVVLAEGGRVADLAAELSAAFTADASLFCADGVHPSSAGYTLIARALAPAVRAAADAATGAPSGTGTDARRW